MSDLHETGGVTPVEGFDFRWAAVPPGRLALWHRPKLRAIRYLARAGCDRVVTLLSEGEGAQEIGRAVAEAGLAWSWIPLAGGRPPEGKADRRVREELQRLMRCFDAGESLLIHCSAGMHRTGMIGYALLRMRGFSGPEALELIEALRPATRDGLTPARLGWGEGTQPAP